MVSGRMAAASSAAMAMKMMTLGMFLILNTGMNLVSGKRMEMKSRLRVLNKLVLARNGQTCCRYLHCGNRGRIGGCCLRRWWCDGLCCWKDRSERERKRWSLLAITVACLMNHSNVNSWKRLLVSLQFENKRWLRIRIQMFICVSEGSCHL